MKQILNIFILLSIALLTSCNKEDREPEYTPLILGDIVTYQYGWCYNNWEERYQFNTTYDRIKDSEYVNGNIENFTYLRSAILVRRISSLCIWL